MQICLRRNLLKQTDVTDNKDVVVLPFEMFCLDIVEERIIEGEEVFTLKKLNELLNKFTNDKTPSMSTTRLKGKLKSKYNNQLIFHPSKARNKSYLVYADYITPGAIIESVVYHNGGIFSMKVQMKTCYSLKI